MEKTKLAMMAALLTLLENKTLAEAWQTFSRRQQDALKKRMLVAIDNALYTSFIALNTKTYQGTQREAKAIATEKAL